MHINWYAVLTGFSIALVLGFVFALFGELTATSALYLAVPGLVGGFVAGYMVSGTGNGALNGGLATAVGGLILLGVLTVVGVLFAGIVPTIGGLFVGLVVLAVNAIPGAVAGAVGGWLKDRREPEATATTASR